MLLKQDNQLVKILNEKDFKNEKELQNFVEDNLTIIANLKFVVTEFSVGNFRIDTLAFDEETMSFKIIEYKNVKNHSLVDQGYTYLKLMLDRKADFVLKYNEIFNKNYKISDIDWSQSRIIFISTIYTKYQLEATDFQNIPIDLIKITRYDDGLYLIDNLQKTSSIKVADVINANKNVEKVNKEVIVYTEEDHLFGKPDNIKDLYYALKERILELDDIDIDVKKVYIAFKGKSNITDIEIWKKHLKIYLNMKKGTLTNYNNFAEDISEKGHHGNGDYEILIKKADDIDLAIPLIKQSLAINKK